MSVIIVAEPGATAEGNLDLMLQQIDACAEAGCDVYKSQWTSDPRLMAARREAKSYLPCYEWLAFPISWHDALVRRCRMREARGSGLRSAVCWVNSRPTQSGW